MSQNRYANVFSRENVVYVFPWALIEDRLPTVDACIGRLEAGFSPDSLGVLIAKALELYGRHMTPEQFKSRKDPLLSAMRQASHKKLNVGLGHIEVDWLLDDDGRFELIPHKTIGRLTSPLPEIKVALSAGCGPAELGAAAIAALDKSRAAQEAS